ACDAEDTVGRRPPGSGLCRSGAEGSRWRIRRREPDARADRRDAAGTRPGSLRRHDGRSRTGKSVSEREPIPMRLPCEACGELHVDEGEFATKPHHTHSCQYCGLTWRPAVECTVASVSCRDSRTRRRPNREGGARGDEDPEATNSRVPGL